jgi:hypothetical protein
MRIAEKMVRVDRVFKFLGVLFVAGSLLTGCASTKVADREQYVTGQISRPADDVYIPILESVMTSCDL